jgi:uncharacterized RDD family membrane protein YckC
MATEQLSEAPQMGQCSVTGKMVPEDELVTIHGQRVCAEGKAILLQRLKAGEAMPGEMEKPPVLRRVGCIILDSIILGVPFWIFGALLGATYFARGAAVGRGMLALLAAVVSIVYFGYLHAMRGQTLGKMTGKIVVVNLDGSPISTQTAFIRALAYAGPNLLSSLALLFIAFTVTTPPVAGPVGPVGPTGAAGTLWLTSLIAMLVGAYGLANCLFALFDRNAQRALHDRIAGTRVILK